MEALASMIDAAVGFRPCEVVPGETDAEFDSSEVQLRLAAALICGQYKRAEQLLSAIRPASPMNRPARTLLAVARGGRDAIRGLPPPAPNELGLVAGVVPVYLRGLAYLASGDSDAAVSEFQRLIDHRGAAYSRWPLYPLAFVQQARAYARAGEAAKACSAYEAFFKFWEHADSDVPILLAARAEYARLCGATSGTASSIH